MASLKKIVLKNSTSLSLNDRFTFLRQQHERVMDLPGVAGPSTHVETLRQNRATLQRASAKNRRLAMQMENRSLVAAALRIKKRNMRQRVNMAVLQQQGRLRSVKDRLSLPPRARLGFRGRGRGSRNASFRGGMRSDSIIKAARARALAEYKRVHDIEQRNSGINVFRPRGQNRLRGGMKNFNFYSPQRRGGSGIRRGFINKRGVSNRGGFNNRQIRNNKQRGFRQRGGRARGQMRGKGQRGGGRGRGRGQTRPVPSRDELDSQLDEYMAGTKAQLDKDLDQYMNVQA